MAETRVCVTQGPQDHLHSRNQIQRANWQQQFLCPKASGATVLLVLAGVKSERPDWPTLEQRRMQRGQTPLEGTEQSNSGPALDRPWGPVPSQED